MKKILVTSDFSLASRHALEYAEWLSLKLGASLTVLHVRPEIKAEDTLDRRKLEKLRAREDESAQRKLQRFTTRYPDTDSRKKPAPGEVRCITRTGSTVDQILQTADAEQVDLVVIGTRAKHNLLDHLLGSVTTHLIGRIRQPLLIIPEGTTYRNIHRIAFALDIELDGSPVQDSLQKIASAIGATVQPFYVNILPAEQRKLREETIEPGQFTMVRDQTISQGIQYFLQNHPSEVLAMYVPQRALPERLLHRSLTKQMAYRSPIPLLLFSD